MTDWWAALSVAKKLTMVVAATLTASMSVVAATVDRIEVGRHIEQLERTDSLVLHELEDIRVNTCLTLVELRGEPNADRCRR